MEKRRKKALFIVNPVSGKKTAKNYLFAIIRQFSDSGYESTVLMTSAKGDALDFAERYAPYHDVVVSCGGDGTLNETVSGIMSFEPSLRPAVGFIPFGTTNDFAATHGIPTNPAEAAKLLTDGKPQPFDVGRLNKKHYFNYVASCGTFADISYSTSQSAKNTLGHLAYVIDGIKSIGGLKTLKLTVSSKEFFGVGEFVYVGISNALTVGGTIKFNKDEVGLDDGKFEVLLVKKPKNALTVVDTLIKLSSGEFDEKEVVFFKTSKLSLRSRMPVSWTVDGEFAGLHRKVVLENIHNAVKIVK